MDSAGKILLLSAFVVASAKGWATTICEVQDDLR